AGIVDVRVTTTAGVTPVSALDQFTYTASVPVVTGVSPAQGLVSGGLTVTITGTGFTGATCTGIVFGTIQAPSCTVVNDTSITAVTPPNAVGPTYLTVTTPNGTSGIVQNFTYLPISAGGGGGSGGTGGGPPAGNGGAVQLPPPTGATVTYTLNFRWTLIIWRGADGASIAAALNGLTGDITAKVSSVYMWDPTQAMWFAYFTGSDGMPGATSMTTFARGGVYWISLTQPGSVTLAGTDG
ncbi:MAG: IPT/TIG domain-containing protein, partial [Tepidiformaceae bacterium]